MLVPVNNIEQQIEKIREILNSIKIDYQQLQEFCGYLTESLITESLLPIKYFYQIEQLIKLFHKKDIIISKELNKALGDVLLNFDHYYDNSEELTTAIIDCLHNVDILGEPAY